MIVNDGELHSRAMYRELSRAAPGGVPVYQQSVLQKDVWETLDGDKDDFLIYDRCGLLTFHIVLPYSFLNYPYVEAAIRATYNRDICNCSSNSTSLRSLDVSVKNASGQFNVNRTAAAGLEEEVTPSGRAADHSHHPHHDHRLHHTSHQDRSDDDKNLNSTAPHQADGHHHHHPPRQQD
ncbi:unnamed protein product [Menidia menidia]|uniref:(Atlantic silverside) hypothetical protein n=1 Tax=Menidia menidia TaxID=238744 RepID=A0A8S4ARW5_9TELE|nr:unnamed protein product [Menidia menidia]